MNLINVVDFIFAVSRSKFHIVAKFSDLLDSVITCTINF